jgi:hypothetical protein
MPQTELSSTFDPDDPAPPAKSPRAITVIGLLAAAALLFSYLGAYKVSAALVNADLISPWSTGSDPRPKWLVIGFLVIIATCAAVGVIMRLASCRSLRDIDRIANDDDD